jgi:integral membrane protein
MSWVAELTLPQSSVWSVAVVSPRLLYRTVAVAEAVTWTLLITAMLLKYVAQLDSPFTFVAGLMHGLVFVTYAGTAVLVGLNQYWPMGRIMLAVATAIVPYATIPFDRRLENRGELEGEWNIAATADRRDRLWARRLLRWLLRRPAVLVAVFVLAVVAILGVLLVVGPPGGWK